MKKNVSAVRLIVATRSSGPPASGKIIKEMPDSVTSGTLYITYSLLHRLVHQPPIPEIRFQCQAIVRKTEVGTVALVHGSVRALRFSFVRFISTPVPYPSAYHRNTL
jgi:hypothetical protein